MNASSNNLIGACERTGVGNVHIISHSGTVLVRTDTEAGADKAMQIHSGTLMKVKLSKAAKRRRVGVGSGGLLLKLTITL